MPASNLSGNTGEVGGGIGAGLSSFVQAYQTALNYQLAKSQAAAQANYQDIMGQAVMKNANTDEAYKQGELGIEGKKIPIAAAEANAKFAPYGSDVLEYYGVNPDGSPKIHDQSQPEPDQTAIPATPPPAPMPPRGLVNPLPLGQVGPQPSPQLIQQSQQDQAQLRAAPVNPLPQGLVGPQPSPAMLQNSQSAQLPPQPIPAQSAPVQPQTRPAGPPQFMPQWQRELLVRNQAEAAKMTAEGTAKGSNTQYGTDARGNIIVTGQSPYTGDALLAQQKTQAEVHDANTNQRSGNMTSVNQFDEDPNTKAARASTVPMNQVLQAMSNKNLGPEQKQAAFMAALKVLDPNVSAESKTPQDALKNSAALTDQVKSILETVQGKGLSDQILNGTLSAAADMQIANTKGMMDASQRAIKAAGFRKNEIDPNLSVDQSVMRAYQGALSLKNKVGQSNTLPSQRPEGTGLVQSMKDTYNSVMGNPAMHPLSGKIIQYHGKPYNVDAVGNMTPVNP